MPQQIDPGKAGDGGFVAQIIAFFMSLVLDHWVEFTTLVLSAIGLVWAVKNYRAGIEVKKLEAEKLRLEIKELAEEEDPPEKDKNAT